MDNAIFFLSGDLSPVFGGDGVAAPLPVADAVAGTETQAVPVAGSAPAQEGGMGMFMMPVIWVAIMVGFYFLAIRPQRKQAKQMKEMQSGLKVGDNVVTNGGMYGRIADVGEDCFVVEFGTNRGVRIPVRKSDILGVKEPQLTTQHKSD